MRTTVIIPDGLFRQVKAAAASRGQSLSAYVSDILRMSVAEESPASREAVRLPTTPGAPLPGVDLHDSAALEDLMSGPS